MYKRSLDEHSAYSWGGVMFKAQFGRAEYSDIAFSITTRVDNSQAYGIVEEWTK